MILDVVLLTLFAGFAAFAGAMLGCVERLKPDWIGCTSRQKA